LVLPRSTQAAEFGDPLPLDGCTKEIGIGNPPYQILPAPHLKGCGKRRLLCWRSQLFLEERCIFL